MSLPRTDRALLRDARTGDTATFAALVGPARFPPRLFQGAHRDDRPFPPTSFPCTLPNCDARRRPTPPASSTSSFSKTAIATGACRSGSEPAEATALAVILDNVQLPRPGVYHFAAALLAAADGQLREVRITELTDHTFYAQAVLADGASVDARPSDALTVALITGAPIHVAPGVLEQAAEHQETLSDLHDEADRAPDDAHAIAEELRTRIAAEAAELTSLQARTERQG